jgi:hypothetical protein
LLTNINKTLIDFEIWLPTSTSIKVALDSGSGWEKALPDPLLNEIGLLGVEIHTPLDPPRRWVYRSLPNNRTYTKVNIPIDVRRGVGKTCEVPPQGSLPVRRKYEKIVKVRKFGYVPKFSEL